MRVCLIAPPIFSDVGENISSRAEVVRSLREPPLGILNLASQLEKIGVCPEVFDVNCIFDEMVGANGARPCECFLDRASGKIAAMHADVFAFGTIAGSYPLTIRLAEAARHSHPGVPIVFGGPQATALDIETMEAIPVVDFVVRGEADETFPKLLEILDRSKAPDELRGITFRRGAHAIRTPDAPVVADLDSLPLPAFHLWKGVRECRYLSVEAGRGCPFSCVFCATSPFFGRRYRMKSPSRVIAQMERIHRDYGVDTFHLVHDTFTALRGDVISFCEALLKSGIRFKWTCSARTDCVKSDLLELMKKAGCTGIFYGVETGSERLQRTIGKNLNLTQAIEAIRSTEKLGMGSTVSLITGFPDETRDDLRSTVSFLVDALRSDRVTAQLYLLTPAAGSPLHDRYRERLVWDGIFSEVTLRNWIKDSRDYTLIRKFPKVFPDFYAIPTSLSDRRYLAQLRDFIICGAARFRWLIIALHDHSGDLLKVFDLWRQWHEPHRRSGKPDDEYYASYPFRTDFLQFVGSAYLRDDDEDNIAVTTLLEYELAMEQAGERGGELPLSKAVENRHPRMIAASESRMDLRTVPRIPPGIHLVHLSADYQCVIGCLKDRSSPRNVPRHPVIVAFRRSIDNSGVVLQLSPLSAALLELCNGKRTAAEISEFFPRLQQGLDQFPREKACLFALKELERQGLVAASR